MQTSNTFAKTKQQAIDFDGFGLQHDVANIQNYRAFFANATSKWSDSAAKNLHIWQALALQIRMRRLTNRSRWMIALRVKYS